MTMLPTNPMDLPTTQRLLSEHIARGDITQSDVDLLKRGYRSMATTTLLGSLVGVPVFIVLSRRRPQPAMLTRLVAASFMASTGSFLGFTIGGAAAAMEVSQHMEDSQRKLRVFEEIMIQSKRTAETSGLFGPTVAAEHDDPSPDSSFSDSTGPVSAAIAQTSNGDVWDAEASERKAEAQRELEVQGKAEPNGIIRQTGTTWDRLRQQNVPRPSSQSSDPPRTAQQQPRRPSNPLDLTTSTSSKYAPGLSVEEKIEQETAEERRREKEEFERLLEREREAAALGKEEGFETGKW